MRIQGINLIPILILIGNTARATIPEPDNVMYGHITLNGSQVTSARTDVVIEARRTADGPAIASYRMGANPDLGNFYVLRLQLESLVPVVDPSASQTGENLFIAVSDGSGIRAQTSYTMSERGAIQRVDFGIAALDSDGDGLPDAWELFHFSNLSQGAASPNPNGHTTLQNFIAGTDPNAPDSAFQLDIGMSGRQTRVSFIALRAEGPGYDGMTRLYTLEANPTVVGGSWSDVPGYISIPGDNQTVNYVTTGLASPGFFRGRISLQGATMPAGDSDGDGLPDAWETLHFGNLNQSGGSSQANGESAQENFIAGTDPNNAGSAFRISVTQTGSNRLVSFFAISAQGVGYEGRQRYYSLETSATATGPWTAVAGFSSILGNNQPVSHQLPTTGAYFRGGVWLQP